MKRTSDRKRKLDHISRLLIIFLVFAFAALGAAFPSRADVATDELTVKVGYPGMDLSEYVEVDTYHWRDLAGSLPIHKVAYSYFKKDSKTKYTAIVDSAQGFYISDLLDYAKIYYGDVISLKFYVEDHKGIRTSFDTGALFRTRYYYEDLAGHRTVVYGKKTVEKEVTETIHHDAEYETETYTDTVHHDAEYATEKYTETVHHKAEYKTEKYTEVVDGVEVEKEREVLVKEAWDEEVEKERKVLVKEAWDEEVEKEREVLVNEAWDEEVTKTVTEEVEDKSKIIEYRFDKAGKYASQVQPMLALEDNWAQFNEEFEHIGPDFTSMNAGNRFRLLFGQTSPTESMTSMSDKYVSCVYAVLDGSPAVGEMGGLDGSYGSHTVDMTVSVYNSDIRDALSGLMNVDSTNTDVLVITGIKVTPDSRYSDLATVTVSYDIVGDGEAAVTAGVGKSSAPIMVSEAVIAGKNPASGGNGSEGENGSGDSGNDKKNKESNSDNKSSSNQDNKNKEIKRDARAESEMSRNTVTYSLSDAAADNFNSAIRQQTQTAAFRDEEIKEIDEVLVEDNTEEKEARRRTLLVLTALMCITIAAGGSVAELLSFRIRLRGIKWS